MTRRVLIPLFLAACICSLSGCSNDCQKLCKEMADYWADCNISYGDADVADCKKSFRADNSSTEEDPSLIENYRSACRQLIGTEENADGERMIALRARFTCEDMEQGPGGAFGATAE